MERLKAQNAQLKADCDATKQEVTQLEKWIKKFKSDLEVVTNKNIDQRACGEVIPKQWQQLIELGWISCKDNTITLSRITMLIL